MSRNSHHLVETAYLTSPSSLLPSLFTFIMKNEKEEEDASVQGEGRCPQRRGDMQGAAARYRSRADDAIKRDTKECWERGRGGGVSKRMQLWRGRGRHASTGLSFIPLFLPPSLYSLLFPYLIDSYPSFSFLPSSFDSTDLLLFLLSYICLFFPLSTPSTFFLSPSPLSVLFFFPRNIPFTLRLSSLTCFLSSLSYSFPFTPLHIQPHTEYSSFYSFSH